MNRNQQDKLDQNHIYFGLSLDALAGSGLTEDEETTATSSPVEAVRAGAVMEHLIYGTGLFPGCCCGLLHPHQSADISDPTKMHRYNTQAVILTAQCHLISVLEVTKLFLTLYFCFPHKCRCHLLHHKSSASNVQQSRIRKAL